MTTNPSLVLCVALALCAGCADETNSTDATCLGPLPAAPATPAAPVADAALKLDPLENLSLHESLCRPGVPGAGWSATLQQLAAIGDGFTLEQLRALKRSRVPADAQPDLDAALELLAARVASETPATLAANLRQRFERAALADLHCGPLELTLVPWTLKAAAAAAADPAVHAELQRLQSSYVAQGSWANAAIQARVRDYAQRILSSPNPDVEARTR